MNKLFIITILSVILLMPNCHASIEKQKLIDARIVLQHKIDDVTNQIQAIEADEATAEDMVKLEYYKETLEKDNPVPENYRGDDDEKII